MWSPPRPRGLLPSRAGARRNVPALRAGPADQHRITGPLCDVDPFRRTPAWPPAQNVRLAHSPHILNLQPPFGLGQNVFCPLGSRPRGRGSLVESDVVGCANAAPPLPPPFSRPKRNDLRAESDQGLQVFGPVRTPPFSRTRLVAGEPPYPVPLGRELHPDGPGSSARPTPPPKPACRQRSTRHAGPDAPRRHPAHVRKPHVVMLPADAPLKR